MDQFAGFGIVTLTVLAMLGSIIAVYVGLTTKNAFLRAERELLQFQVGLFEKLDGRYWRKEDHTQFANAMNKEEEHYRSYAGKQLSGIEVEVHQNKSDVTIMLKGIMDAINKPT